MLRPVPPVIPNSVPRSKMLEFVESIGLGAEDVRSLKVTPDSIEVEVMQKFEHVEEDGTVPYKPHRRFDHRCTFHIPICQ